MGWTPGSKPGHRRLYITGWLPLCLKLGLNIGHSIQLDVDPADYTRLQLSLLPEGTCPEAVKPALHSDTVNPTGAQL